MRKRSKRRSPANRRKTGGSTHPIVELGKATRFKAGESGNPSGRPRDQVSIALRKILARPCPQYADGRTWAEAISVTLCNLALRGNVQAASEIADRTEGKPAQAIAVSGSLDLRTPEEIDRRLRELTARIRQQETKQSGAPN